MKRRMAVILCIVLVTVMLFSGCGGTDAQAKPAGDSAPKGEAAEPAAAKDTLTVAIAGDVVTLDPNAPLDSANDAVAQAELFEALFEVSPEGELVNVLCESYEYEDDTTLVLHLIQGVKFHNGEEMTAEDVLFSYQHSANHPILASNWVSIDFENTEIVDDYTIRMKLHEPYASLLYNLATTTAYVVSKAAYEADPDGFARNPVGTGPYKFVSWDSGVSLSFEKFDGYWNADGAANIRELVLKVVPEATNRGIQIETGEVDMALDIQASDIETLQQNADVALNIGEADTVTAIRINTTHSAPLGDQRVRLALMKAIDREALVQNVYEGSAVVAQGIMAPGIPGYNDDYAVENYGYDVEAAKQLLAEAGYADGFTVEITMYESATLNTCAEIIAHMWEEIGVKTNINIYEIGTFFSYFESEDYDMCITNRATLSGDADMELYTLWHSDYQGLYQDLTVDELLEESRRTLDNAARYELYAQIQRRLQEACHYLPISGPQAIYAANTALNNTPNAKMLARGIDLAGVSWG